MTKHAAHYRGYMIEGEKERQGWLLHVSPVKPELPILRHGDFRVTDKTSPHGGGCGWLYRNAINTGSSYWWNRYYECIGYY